MTAKATGTTAKVARTRKPSRKAKKTTGNGNGVKKANRSGTPPNLCIVGTPAEMEYINTRPFGKAGVVHPALSLLMEVTAGEVKLEPVPDYIRPFLK